MPQQGSVANFETGDGGARAEVAGVVSGSQVEHLVDEPTLSANIIRANPVCLSLADHVSRLVSGNRSLGRLELAKALLGLHSAFDRSMILLHDFVQVLDWPVSAASAQGSFRFHRCNRRTIEAGLIGVDDAGLRMRWIAEPDGTGAWPRRHCATPRAGSRQWRRWNRWLDRGNTNDPSRECTSHRHATICWSA
jgi:hypothetical protein